MAYTLSPPRDADGIGERARALLVPPSLADLPRVPQYTPVSTPQSIKYSNTYTRPSFERSSAHYSISDSSVRRELLRCGLGQCRVAMMCGGHTTTLVVLEGP